MHVDVKNQLPHSAMSEAPTWSQENVHILATSVKSHSSSRSIAHPLIFCIVKSHIHKVSGLQFAALGKSGEVHTFINID